MITLWVKSETWLKDEGRLIGRDERVEGTDMRVNTSYGEP